MDTQKNTKKDINDFSATELKSFPEDRGGAVILTRKGSVRFEDVKLVNRALIVKPVLDYRRAMAFDGEGHLIVDEDSFDNKVIISEEGVWFEILNLDPNINKDERTDFTDLAVGDVVILRKGGEVMKFLNYSNIHLDNPTYLEKSIYMISCHDIVGVTRYKKWGNEPS